jgi:N-acetylglucosaminyl-diphospho-decaprenol L-rhamnosyltransferase
MNGILALGIVTYNNPAAQLRRLTHSIRLAAEQLSDFRYALKMLSIDCGSTSEWEPIGGVHRHLAPEGNLGFGGGMNRLIASAFTDPLVSRFLCINPDGILHRDLLVEMLRCAEHYSDSLIEARQFPEEHPKPYDPNTGLTMWASGACMLIPRRVYEKIGGFDENIFMYMEDVDFSWRARAAGFTIHVAPRALFAHSVLGRKPSLEVEKRYYFSARYMAYKWRKPKEQAMFERIILERGFVTTLPALPRINNPNCRAPMDANVATFAHGFAYAPLRWI